MVIIMFQDGMGNLQLNQDGIRLEGISEFFLPLYVNEIQSRRVSCSLWSSQQLQLACWSILCSADELGIPTISVEDLFKAADKLVLISQCQGSYHQFINNNSQLPSELWLDNTFIFGPGKERSHSFSPVLCPSPRHPPPHFLSSSSSALSGPPIGRRWVIGCFSAPLWSRTTQQEITGDYKGTRVLLLDFQSSPCDKFPSSSSSLPFVLFDVQ